MAWLVVIVFLSAVTTGLAINRPVYKIVLTQKGYAQEEQLINFTSGPDLRNVIVVKPLSKFLQYDIETPPLREFTFCTWFRIYDLTGDQSIFTYVANGNNRVIRLWLDSGGRHINISINAKVSASSPVEITEDVWRHICLSYQSDYGAWALYIDSRLISCQASQSLYGFLLPGGGSVIVGYGTDVNGAQNGLEGEIFGVNMILMSTIERNYSMKNNPEFEQKPFRKNGLKSGEQKLNYIIFNDLQSDEVNNNFETTKIPDRKVTSSFIRLRTPHSFVEHEVGSNHKSQVGNSIFSENDFFPLPATDATKNDDAWNLNMNPHQGKYRMRNKGRSTPRGIEIRSTPSVSEYEVPPPAPSCTVNTNSTERRKGTFGKKYDEPSEFELPPPEENDSKVYGQWTSSRFAGSVLNYLKNKHVRSWDQKKVVPQTIPLNRLSDSFPYASDFKLFKVRPPINFQRKNVVEKQQFNNKRIRQINVQILEDDLRNNIIKSHARTMPMHVEISNRGIAKKGQQRRFYRNINDEEQSLESSESAENVFRSNSLELPKTRKINQPADYNLQTQNLMAILPFLKSLEYFIEDSQNTATREVEKKHDIYTKSLSLGNKWHNVKSYSNDYTPREIKGGFDNSQKSIEAKIAQANKKHPSIRLKYKHEDRKVLEFKDDESILKGRELAMQVSNQSNSNKESVSILKYNHGFLPVRKAKAAAINESVEQRKSDVKKIEQINFLVPVKIGNALNERPIIGENVEQNKKSFEGGDERIPDIQRHRAENDRDDFRVPGSLGPRICKNVELYDRVLYVQTDGSIDMSHILSPVRMKNNGIEFIMQNYKKCSLQESSLQNNRMLFIDWSKTPVRLFGGAYAKKTTDLCGFF